MRTIKLGLLFLFLVLPFATLVSQTSNVPKLTDLFTPDEFKKAGLSKLSSDEMQALNSAFFRVLIAMNSRNATSGANEGVGSDVAQDLDFYDSRGRAAVYVGEDSDLTIYLWSGKPVAYIEDDSVYGFNGKHLGWLRGGAIYDHDGNAVTALADNFTSPVTQAPLKGLKQLKPLKSLKELKPLKPLFTIGWSRVPAQIFFEEGAN